MVDVLVFNTWHRIFTYKLVGDGQEIWPAFDDRFDGATILKHPELKEE